MNEEYIRLVRILQEDFPLVSRPFREIGKRAGMSEEHVIELVREMKEKGMLRRFGAALAHRRVGLGFNPMIVMELPEAAVTAAGRRIAEKLDYVTHCYHRAPAPDFSYRLYAMIHCGSLEEAEEKAREVAGTAGTENWKMLFSTEELKKTGMKYFTE